MPGVVHLPLFDTQTTMRAVMRPSNQPKTRGDCPTERPCGFTTCPKHLWAKNPDNIPGRRWKRHSGEDNARGKVEKHTESSCALDIVDENPDGISRKEVARLLGETPERARQEEIRALNKFNLLMAILERHNDGEHVPGCPWCRD